METREIKEILSEQLQLLSERSQETGNTAEELVSLTGAMIDISMALLPR